MNSLSITVTQVSILAAEIGIGYVLAKKGKIPQTALQVLTFLCANIALPCSIFLAVSSLENSPVIWRSLLLESAIIIPCSIVQIAVCFLLFRKSGNKQKPVYQIATVYGNSAFMGIPIVTALIGSEAVIFVTMLVIFDTIFLFTHASLALSDEKFSFGALLKKIFTPVTIALLLGAIICITGIQLPPLIQVSITDFRGMLTPLAMIIIGMQLAGQNLSAIFKRWEFYGVAVIKLLLWPIVIMFSLLPFRQGIPIVIITTIVICKATPQPAILGAVAAANGLDGEAAAGVVGLNTILSAITLPVIAGICTLLY
jgi:hypothetical protein